MNSFYDKKMLLRYMLMLIGVCVAMKFSGGAAFALVAVVAVSTLFRNKIEYLLFWVMLITCSPNINPYFFPHSGIYSLIYRLVCTFIGLYGAIMFFSQNPSRYVTPLMGIMVYMAYMFVPSASGWAPVVSFMKLFLFVIVYMSVMYVANKVINDKKFDIKRLRNVFLVFAMFFIFGSILVMPLGGICYMNAAEIEAAGGVVPGSLFKGIANHSQALGTLVAAIMILLLADLVYCIQKPDKLYIALLLCGVFVVYRSGTRTAMGTLIAATSFIIFFFMQMRGIKQSWKSKVVGVSLCLVALGGMGILVVPQVRQGIVKFAMKYDREDTTNFDMDYAMSTRAGSVESQIDNFKKKPAIGWGFQVSEQVAFMYEHSSSLPLSAPVEKGVWVTAILEEGGVLGEIIYIGYLVTAMCVLLSRKIYMGAAMFFALHVSNLGELTMFTMTAVGGIWHMLVLISCAFDAKRMQKKNMTPFQYYQPRQFAPTGYNPMWR